MEFIQVKGVTKEFGKHQVLKDVNLEIEEGDVLGIIGQSGSGKTTLLKLMAGFLHPTEGEVVYLSKINQEPKSIHKNLAKIKKYLAFTPQHTSFYPKLTVKENLLHFGRLYGIKENTLNANAKNLLEFTGLYEHRNKLAEHLSGGMKRRLDICCSLLHKPKMIFLDEPTADLDPQLQKEVVSLIQEVNKQGMTIVIASHHLESIEEICNKVAVIHNGEVYSFGAFEDVRKPYLKDQITINVHTGREKERILNLVQRLPLNKIVDQGSRLVLHPHDSEKTITQLLRIIKEENLQLHDLDVRKPSLSEIFSKITQEKRKE